MTQTYIPLANTTLASAVSTVTFGSIPDTYNDLILVVQATGSTTLEGRIRLNNNAVTYHNQRVSATGSTASAAQSAQNWAHLSVIATAGTGTNVLQINASILGYSRTNIMKSILSRAGNAATGTDLIFNTWENTSAVTSVQVIASTGNWAIGSTFALYGVIA